MVLDLSFWETTTSLTRMSCTLTLIIALAFVSCKNDHLLEEECFSREATVRQITNAPASIRQQTNGVFYIVEKGTIDIRLNPCYLQPDLQINNLDVVVSGTVKATIQGGPGPCCVENFIITKITRS